VDADIIVIGGGAAGMMAAGTAALRGKSIVLLEKNDKLGKKLYITGKGRCNITNNCEIEGFLGKMVANPHFMYSAFYAMPPDALISLFAELGLATKIERGGRVFPVSDKSSDVIAALARYMARGGVDVRLNSAVAGIRRDSEIFDIALNGGKSLKSRRLIMATGGLSYPATGSTGEGLDFAQNLGHKIVATLPSLVPLNCAEGWVADLMGLTLKNVRLTAFCGDREVFSDMGEMLFTHFGISGPLAISASAYITQMLAEIKIDLKPALKPQILDARLLRDFSINQNREIKNALDDLLPKSIIPIIIQQAAIPPDRRVHSITRNERAALIGAIKGLALTATGNRGFAEAVITAGGVDTRQIDPSTMESKTIPGLYFAGEMLDIHALTGGYNLQIAFSTGYLAGVSQ